MQKLRRLRSGASVAATVDGDAQGTLGGRDTWTDDPTALPIGMRGLIFLSGTARTGTLRRSEPAGEGRARGPD